jgi:hypothetical protein
MSDQAEIWRDVRHERQEKRASNRVSSRDLLRAAGVVFVEKNDGTHVIVDGGPGGRRADFWPGTGLWMVRGSSKRHRGVRRLLKWLGK